MPHNVQQPPWSLDLQSLLKAVGGECLYEKEKVFSGLGSDSRKNLKGHIFFALSGPRFDGHDFLSQAVQQGASCLVVHKEQMEKPFPVTLIKVPDTLTALQNLSVYWRRQLN
ncbi:MAG: Mur ligase domain-containing protein, partial [Bdellovibrionales bacterium]|nr:Mur ligase domain-containing protein [Bdellovibrionales bacterium]